MSTIEVSAGAVAALVVVGVAVAIRPIGASRPLPRAVDTDVARHRPPRGVVVAAIAAGAGALTVVAGPGLTIVLGGIVAGTIVARRRRVARAHRSSIEAAMPDAIELLVMSLHAGYSPTQAIGRLVADAPIAVRPAFEAVEYRLHRGTGFADALVELTAVCGRCALPLVNAMSAAVRDGLPLAPVLDRLSDEANASRRRHGEAAARRLPVQLSFPLVVCTLPSFVLLAIAPAVLGALSTLRGTTLR